MNNEEARKYIKAHLASGKMTAAVKESIQYILKENERLASELDESKKISRSLMNRCRALGGLSMCCFCGFYDDCMKMKEGDH